MAKGQLYHKAGDWADDAIPLHYELQLRFYMAVADVDLGAFSAIWGNNPESDVPIPEITRDKAKKDMIFQRLDEWIWSLEHDKPPTMSSVAPQLAWENSVYTRLVAISNDLLQMGFPCEAELVQEGLPAKEVEKVRRMLAEYGLSGWDMPYILIKDKELHEKMKRREKKLLDLFNKI